MKSLRHRSPWSGFALVIVLSLLALAVLCLTALGVLVHVDGEISSVSAYQVKARQNALLGFNAALGSLRTYGGVTDNVTAMAGITGIAANAANSTRHWCGVWTSGGAFVGWLCSGASGTMPPPVPATNAVALVDSGTVGAATSNSEHVWVTKIPVTITEVPGQPGVATIVGHYAYWIGDEGVKISAYAPAAPINFLLPSTPSTLASLGAAVGSYPSRLPTIVSFEQLRLLPTPSAPLAMSIMNDSFHHATLTNVRYLAPGSVSSGMINLNTNSAYVWRSVCETYNGLCPGAPIPATKLTATINLLANNIAASASGKNAYGPFTSTAAFGGSTLLANALSGTGVSAAQFMAAVGPGLSVRSDTFRLRAYGEALNPFDATKVEAIAYCEAIVQPNPQASGPRYLVVYFRWLGPADI